MVPPLPRTMPGFFLFPGAAEAVPVLSRLDTNAIAAFDEVESVLLMSGGYDLQLVIKGQTFQEIALFVAKRLSPLDDVLSTATHFVLRTYKKEGRLYQDEEIDERECTVL